MGASRNVAAIENSIRIHGILLEHEAKALLDSALNALGVPPRASALSKSYVRRIDGENRTIEIDVLAESSSFHVDPFDDIYREPTLETWLKPFGFGAYLSDAFIVECKGHPRDGFLICRRMNAEVNLVESQPLFIDPKNERVDARACIESRLVSVIYKHLKNSAEYCPSVDWCYFFSGNLKELNGRSFYEQDREGNTNKFLRAVEQLNLSLNTYLGHRTEIPSGDGLQRVLPIIVTNADLYLLGIEDAERKVSVFESVPWVAYKNCYAQESSWSSVGVNGVFYVVNATQLPNFIRVMRGLVDPKVALETPPAPKLVHTFEL